MVKSLRIYYADSIFGGQKIQLAFHDQEDSEYYLDAFATSNGQISSSEITSKAQWTDEMEAEMQKCLKHYLEQQINVDLADGIYIREYLKLKQW